MEMDELKNYLNTEVKIKIDRRMGTQHPKWGFVYMVNYGYVPETISADGEEIDAYLLG
jgi:inorganic pyrophosphatase